MHTSPQDKKVLVGDVCGLHSGIVGKEGHEAGAPVLVLNQPSRLIQLPQYKWALVQLLGGSSSKSNIPLLSHRIDNMTFFVSPYGEPRLAWSIHVFPGWAPRISVPIIGVQNPITIFDESRIESGLSTMNKSSKTNSSDRGWPYASTSWWGTYFDSLEITPSAPGAQPKLIVIPPKLSLAD